MADVTVANTAPGIAGKTLACHDADGVTTGIWTLASPLALRGGAPANQTWRLSVAGSGNLNVLADGTGLGLSLNTAGDLYEKGRATPLGHWLNVPYDPANFSSNNGPGFWSVEASDVGAYLYSVIGKSMWLTFHIIATTVSGSPYELRLAIPGGYTAATTYIMPALTYFNAGTWGAGFVVVLGGAQIGLRLDVNGNTTWGSATNGTHVSGTVHIPLS